MAQRHAVIIGINKYPNLAHVGNYDLHGCVNDAKLMKSVLIDKFNFADSHIVELHNEQANRDAIVGQMNRLVDEIDKDDIVVFHFSGHGSRRRAADEDAAKDSTIMPSDSGRDPKPNRDISDFEINEWLGRLSKKTRYITLTFDCCHSGTMTRDAFGDTARVVVDDNRAMDEMGLSTQATGSLDRSKLGASGFLMNSESFVVMSGCRDDQLSREFSQEDKGPEFRNGALTYFLTRELLQAKPGTTYRDVFEPARLNVIERYKGDQNPQIEGRQDREIFGVRDIEAIRFIAVESVDGDYVTLAGGAAHGLHTQSLWSVYPAGTKTIDGATSLGLIEITEVDALTTKAVIRETHGEITAGARCVEKVPSQTQFQLKVDLSALPDEQRTAIKPGIEASPLLALSKSAGTADMGVYVLRPREAATSGDPVPQVQLVQTSSWAVVDAAGVLAMPLHATNEENVVELLIKNLETRARFKNALNLDNPDSTLDVEFNIYKQVGKDKWELANGGDCVFQDGDRLSFEIINREKEAVYVNLLDFEPTGAISHFYPPRGSSEMIEAGRTQRVGRGNQVLRLRLDDAVAEDTGLETLKAFITSNETDFRWLEQGATRSMGRSQLRKQFEAAYNGPSTRAVVFEMEEEEESDDWKSINRFFHLQRRLV